MEDRSRIKSNLQDEYVDNSFLFLIEIRKEFLSNMKKYLYKSNSSQRREDVKEMQLDSLAVKNFIEKYFDLTVDFKEKFQKFSDDFKSKNESDFDSDIKAWNGRIIEMKKEFNVLSSQIFNKLKNENIVGLFEKFMTSGSEIFSLLLIFEG